MNQPKMRTTSKRDKDYSEQSEPDYLDAKKGTFPARILETNRQVKKDKKLSHSLMEKQYRSDMNQYIKRLMDLTPSCKEHNGTLNKVQILSKASDWMQVLLDERKGNNVPKVQDLMNRNATLEAQVKEQARLIARYQSKKLDNSELLQIPSPNDEETTPSTAVNPQLLQDEPGPIRRTKSRSKTSPTTPDKARRRLAKSTSFIIPETPSGRTQSPLKSPVRLPIPAPLSAFNDPTIPASASSESSVYSFAGPSFFLNPSLSTESLFSMAPSALESFASTPMIDVGYIAANHDETVAAAAELLRVSALMLSPNLSLGHDQHELLNLDHSDGELTPPSQTVVGSPSSLMMSEFIISTPEDVREWEL